MAILAREAQIVYAGYSVGGIYTGRILRDIYVSDDSYESSTVEYTFTIQEETLAAFDAACAAAEVALRVPHSSFALTGLGSKSFSTSTGFNSLPSINKVGHPSDSALSRTYRARIEFGRQADNSSSSGRRVTRTSVNVAYNPARVRTVTITGEWTTLGSGARTQYEGQITSYANGILAGLTGTYKLLREPQTSNDDANNVIRITIEYEEVADLSVGGGDADVRAESIIISKQESQPGDTPSAGFVVRVSTMTAHYEAYIEKTVTNLVSKWDTLRISLISKIRTTYGGDIVVIQETPDFDFMQRRITCTMVCTGFPGNTVIECRASTEHDTDEGIVLVPVWDNNKWSRYKFEGPGSEVRTVHIAQRVVGFFFGPQGSPLTFPDQFSGRGDLVLKRRTTNAIPQSVGGTHRTTGKIVSDITETRVYERAHIIKGATDTSTLDTVDHGPQTGPQVGAPTPSGGGNGSGRP